MVSYLFTFYLQMKSYVCPTKGQSENDTVLAHHLNHEEVISIEVINSGKTGIQARLSFQGMFHKDAHNQHLI